MSTLSDEVRELAGVVDDLLGRVRVPSSPPAPAPMAAIPSPPMSQGAPTPGGEEAAELIRRALRRLKELG